jgi:hypothetical protein
MSTHEKLFVLDLPAVVRGCDARAGEFVEPARLSSVSAEEARLWLKAPVEPGAKLLFSLFVPRTLYLGSPFRLSLSGIVREVESCPESGRPGRLVRLRLDPGFRVSPEAA